MATPSPLYSEFAARLLQLKKAYVLKAVDENKIDASNGLIVCGCGDGDQEHHYTSFLKNIFSDRLHRIQNNGGPISMPKSSPLYFVTDDDGKQHEQGAVFRLQLRDSVKLKHITAVPFVAHVPCGAAMLASMPIDDLIRQLVAAKRDFETHYGTALNVQVPCLVHVDWTVIAPELGKGHRTYYVNPEAAETWLAMAPPLVALNELIPNNR